MGVTLRQPIMNEETNRLHGGNSVFAEERREPRGCHKRLEKRGTSVFWRVCKAFHNRGDGVSDDGIGLAGMNEMLTTKRTKEGNEETSGGKLESRGNERLEEGIHGWTVHGGKSEVELAQLAPFLPTVGVDPLGGRFPREVNGCVAVHEHIRNHGSLDETPYPTVPDFPPRELECPRLPPSAQIRR